MYKRNLEEIAIDPQNPTSEEQELARYLDSISFAERLEKKEPFTNTEAKEIYKDFLTQYVEGKRNQEFVIDLASILEGIVFSDDVIHPDEDLLSIACDLEDLKLDLAVRNKILTKEEIDTILQSALKLLSDTKNQ